MDNQELKLKKRAQFIVVACVSMLFILVIIVIFQSAQLMTLNKKADDLANKNSDMQRIIDRLRDETDYFGSDEFLQDIEKYLK